MTHRVIRHVRSTLCFRRRDPVRTPQAMRGQPVVSRPYAFLSGAGVRVCDPGYANGRASALKTLLVGSNPTPGTPA
jgi:hypothetical protein